MHSTCPLSCLQTVFRSASDIPSLSETHKSRITNQIYCIWLIFQPGLLVCGMVNVINCLINQRSCISSQTGYVNLLPFHVKIFLTWKTMAFQASICRGQQLLVRDDPSIFQTHSWQVGMWFDAAKPKSSIQLFELFKHRLKYYNRAYLGIHTAYSHICLLFYSHNKMIKLASTQIWDYCVSWSLSSVTGLSPTGEGIPREPGVSNEIPNRDSRPVR